MTLFIQGGVNPSALVVPDIIVNVGAPPAGPVQGVPSNVLGIVGTANWGPVNSAALLSAQQASALFGAQQPRARDLMTAINIAALNGATVFAPVRVTDGTDTAATATIATNLITLTARYTGTRGNQAALTLSTGSAAGTFKATISLPNQVPETFDNIGGTGAAFWANLAAAINGGQGASRGPSQIMVATAGAGTTAPTAGTTTLSGGTDGAAGVTATQQLGVDGLTRTGMYALRGLGCAVAMLADCASPASWSTQTSFGISEACQMVDANVAGDTAASFAATMATAGVDSPWFKAFVGDWAYFLDTANNVTRLVSPAAFYAGLKVAQRPAESALNKPLYGLVGTQRSTANSSYSSAELQAIAQARGDVIANPSPGGAFFGCRFGRNTSSDPVRHQDAYTTLTDFLAVSLNASGGQFVGRLMTPDEYREAQSSIAALLQQLQTPVVGQPQIAGFTVVVTGNPASGVQNAKVQVTYLGIVEYFLIDLVGGTTVQTTSTFATAA